MTLNHSAPFDYFGYRETAPLVVDALQALGKAVDDSGLEKQLTELLKIRVSQLNGCAFCLQFHLDLARKTGLPAIKADLVATWHDCDIYSDRERAALAWAEALTLMNQKIVTSQQYLQLKQQFSGNEIAFLTAAIANINAWNRIAGGLHFPPMIPASQLPTARELA